jgi:hypothetical protein
MRQSGSVAVWKAPYGQSGKEAEKPIGKILARTAFYGNFFADASADLAFGVHFIRP